MSPLPDAVRAELQAAIAHHQAGRLGEAEALYRRVLAQAPGHPDALHFLGLLAHQAGNHAAAVELIGAALRVIPEHAQCHLHLGLAMQSLGRLDEALACFERALSLNPGLVAALNNRGNALQALGRFDEAIAAYRQSLAQCPDDPDMLNNLGHALDAAGQPAEAIASFQRAQALRPQFAAALCNEGVAHLRQGDFVAGWRLFEWRHRALDARLVREYREPLWLGDQPLTGKTLLIHHEQGLGDTIQMLRYVPELAARGARVLIEVPAALEALARSVAGEPVVVAEGLPLPPFDLQCPMMSLPLACGTTLATIPARMPYLAATPASRAAWAARLGPATGRRIGLVWSGSPGHQNDRLRSIPLSLFAPLLKLSAEFHALQREYRADDRQLLPQLGLRDWSPQLTSLADTAGLVDQLDLVITVDTAVAHLAGALGKPVWLLLPVPADYRWLLDRTDSPWYPTMQLYRQRAGGDWASVLDAVTTALLRE